MLLSYFVFAGHIDFDLRFIPNERTENRNEHAIYLGTQNCDTINSD